MARKDSWEGRWRRRPRRPRLLHALRAMILRMMMMSTLRMIMILVQRNLRRRLRLCLCHRCGLGARAGLALPHRTLQHERNTARLRTSPLPHELIIGKNPRADSLDVRAQLGEAHAAVRVEREEAARAREDVRDGGGYGEDRGEVGRVRCVGGECWIGGDRLGPGVAPEREVAEDDAERPEVVLERAVRWAQVALCRCCCDRLSLLIARGRIGCEIVPVANMRERGIGHRRDQNKVRETDRE
jgi:hypothetical protein